MIGYILANMPWEIIGGGVMALFGVLWAVIRGGSNRRRGAGEERQRMREELQNTRDKHAAIDATFVDADDAYSGLRARSDSD